MADISRLRRAVILIVGTVLVSLGMDAKIKTVSIEYIYQVPENISMDEARETAVTRARLQAIADEFGTLVTQSTSVMVENRDSETHSDFLSIGGSELKGEWLEDSDPPTFEYITDGGSLAIRVKVSGKIRELEGVQIPFEAKLLRNGINETDESDRFISGDDLYVSFTSPAAGYLAIYLIDKDKNAYCLLPYQSQNEGIFQVKANKKYLFFNSDYSGDVNRNIVDQFIVDTDCEQERNRVMVIFSPNKFYKGADSKISMDCPRSMAYSEFQKWLNSVKKKDLDLSISERAILITAKK